MEILKRVEILKRQVGKARRLLRLQQLLEALPWWLFGTLLVAVVAIGAAKFWPIPGVPQATWAWSWVGGAIAVGFLGAIVWVVTFGRNRLDAALEIDRRFGLKERVSSTLALDESEWASPAGQALMRDAIGRVEKIDLRDRFGLRLDRRAILPLAPAALAFVLAMFVNERGVKNTVEATGTTAAEEVKNAAKSLEKRAEELRKAAAELGLKDLDAELAKLQNGTKDLSKKPDADRKQALMKLNDFAQELEKRREQLGSNDRLKDQLKQLKGMEKGPAEKVSDALQKGDFQQAMKEMQKLQEKLAEGKLDEKQKIELAEQLDKMKQALQQMAERQEQAKEDLKKEIEKLRQSGQLDQAMKLQKQLEQLSKSGAAMKKLEQLAKKLGECSECMKNGDSQGAKQAMAALSDQLAQMSQEMSELEMLSNALDQIAMAKDAMNCANCNGMGCSMCQGMGNNMQLGMKPGMGLGRGRGQGDRPEERTDTNNYDTSVKQRPGRGKQLVQGEAYGPNQRGLVLESIKEEFQIGAVLEEDSLTNQKLPRSQRQHVKEYIDAINGD